MKVALTLVLPDIVITQVLVVPEHAPFHPPNVDPLPVTACNVICVPAVYDVWHVPPLHVIEP